MAIYLEWDGIEGDVTAEGYEKKVEVNSFQYGIGRGIGSPAGGSKDRESSAPSISEIVVTKPMDSSSFKIMDAACEGTGKKVKVRFAMTAPGTGTLADYLTYDLDQVLVSGYSVSSGGDQPTESISLNFTKIEMNYIPASAENTDESPMRFGWDLAKQKKV